MAGTVVADTLQAASTSTLVLKNGVANTPPTVQDSAGTQIGTFCRAFVNFNGTTNTGGFCTIRSSFNVSSITDNGVGDYTVNLATAMPDANYSVVTFNGKFGVAFGFGLEASAAPTTSTYRYTTWGSSFTQVDVPVNNVAIFR